jgi:hypothetical protein
MTAACGCGCALWLKPKQIFGFFVRVFESDAMDVSWLLPASRFSLIARVAHSRLLIKALYDPSMMQDIRNFYGPGTLFLPTQTGCLGINITLSCQLMPSILLCCRSIVTSTRHVKTFR